MAKEEAMPYRRDDVHMITTGVAEWILLYQFVISSIVLMNWRLFWELKMKCDEFAGIIARIIDIIPQRKNLWTSFSKEHVWKNKEEIECY